jgi:hypothetical protein
MNKTIIFLFVLFPFLSFSQQYSFSGKVIDPDGTTLPSATVALLNPLDSTLSNFCITDNNGLFELKNLKKGELLLQVAFIGYQTYYKKVVIPLADPNPWLIGLKPLSYELGEAQVTAEKIPILIKNDTIEYNAGAFKTKPDAVAEDLLKKLPGVEVDRSGNIKAMGENVNKVLVDGKEFFSTDPKVATKNLPAESINKVQVYNKKSDESELLGIDDSEYDKTINFVLKDDMKKAIFGDVKIGGGYEDFYIGNTKVYRFSEKHQFAALGMLNNINRPGFSMQDYFDFNGGLRNMVNSEGGGMITIGGNGNVPVNFGQPQNGKITSGALGLNYSYELKKNNRFNISYIGNGSEEILQESSLTRNFTNENSFEQNSTINGDESNRNHVFNLGWRNKSDSIQHYMINSIVSLQDNKSESGGKTESYSDGTSLNTLLSNSMNTSNQLRTSVDGSWMRKGKGNWKMIKASGKFAYNQSLNDNEWLNITNFATIPLPVEENQLLNKQDNLLQYSATITGMRKFGDGFYFEPSLTGGSNSESTNREQGVNQNPFQSIDSLSYNLTRNHLWISPKLKFKIYRIKSKFNFGLAYEWGNQENSIKDSLTVNKGISYLLPFASWDYDYKSHARVGLSYRTSTIMPVSSQLVPIINNTSPLIGYYGNRNLKPEYQHVLGLNWYLFDSFSFTSVFATLQASYTQNKINRSITIDDNLRQSVMLVNVPEDYSSSLNLQFSTPLRFLGVNVNININESWNKGISYVNDIVNTNTNLSHNLRISMDNRKKEKWDFEVGGKLDLTDASYSIQKQLNRKYFNYSYFGEIKYNPTDKWHFRLTGDVTNYDAQSFGEKITIPLVSAEINYHFLPNKRAMISIEGVDLLNKNTGLTRSSNLNYLRETSSNTIGRFILLSFKFRLNKFGSNSGGIIITK